MTSSNATTPEVSTTADAELAVPQGFTFAGTHCGIKRTRPDLGVLLSATPAVAAACFTRNPVRAACVQRNAELVPAGSVRGIVVNSGNANAMTGADGLAANQAMADALAGVLACPATEILTASTGVIGVPLNHRLIAKALPTLVEAASDDPMSFAEAILTTDTCTKIAHVSVTLPGTDTPIKLFGAAKGSGMIHPNMATTLGYVCTDAAVAPALLDRLLKGMIDGTFNAITVDGDTSTNDTVFVLANGASGVFVEGEEATAAFADALRAVLLSLATQVARDGEGATRLLVVDVTGAPDDATAQALARGICRSSLFKCSVFSGQDEWGRLAAAAGQAACENGLAIDQDKLRIAAQGLVLVENGVPNDAVESADVRKQLRGSEITWSLDLGAGEASFRAFGCDLSYDYVRINADEALQVEVTPGGTIARNISLAAYSPRLKHQLLVDGLSYVRRFSGLRALVYVHGTAARRFDLLASLTQDLELCLDAGMKVLLVVPNDEVAGTLESAMEQAGQFVTTVAREPVSIQALLDRGHLCMLVEGTPEPGELVDLAIKLGSQKLIALGDDQGLHDHTGLVSQLSPELLLAGLDRGRFHTNDPEGLALARHAARQGVPALHLVDGRLPHALVGELFTDQGIGTLVTRQAVS